MLVDGEKMPGARWFEGARLNFAENLLRRDDASPALIFVGENGSRRELSWAVLQAEVRGLAAALAADGVGVGDRVAGYMPNLPETIIAMLAATALRGDLVLGLAGLRGRRRARPVRPDRAQGAVRGRRLSLCRQAHRHPGQGAGGGGRHPRPRAHRAGAVPRCGRAGGLRDAVRRVPQERGQGARVRAAAVRPSGLYSLFFRNYRESPRRSCTAPAARCSSTSRSTACTPTRGPASASSTSRPAAG